MRNAILISILLLSTGFLHAQDCNSPDNLLVFSGSVNFRQGVMVPAAKLGIWRNVKPSGITVFAGYEDGSFFMSNASGKAVTETRFYSSFFVEFGYKLRLNPKMFLHTNAGIDKMRTYLASELLYQLGNTVLLGCNYRKHSLGLSLIVRFN